MCFRLVGDSESAARAPSVRLLERLASDGGFRVLGRSRVGRTFCFHLAYAFLCRTYEPASCDAYALRRLADVRFWGARRTLSARVSEFDGFREHAGTVASHPGTVSSVRRETPVRFSVLPGRLPLSRFRGRGRAPRIRCVGAGSGAMRGVPAPSRRCSRRRSAPRLIPALGSQVDSTVLRSQVDSSHRAFSEATPTDRAGAGSDGSLLGREARREEPRKPVEGTLRRTGDGGATRIRTPAPGRGLRAFAPRLCRRRLPGGFGVALLSSPAPRRIARRADPARA